ncbi:MAG: hypothetical protein H6566_06025 [Lewinellaceae bacterium]|nr:hypothetical protein [Lewinellaceae bacterium]
MVSQDETVRHLTAASSRRPTFSMGQSMLKLLMEEQMKEQEIAVQKWITQLLGEMSDRWFFDDKTEVYARIRSQLERLTIEPPQQTPATGREPRYSEKTSSKSWATSAVGW